MTSFKELARISVLCLVLSACGGEGGSPSAPVGGGGTPPPTNPTPTDPTPTNPTPTDPSPTTPTTPPVGSQGSNGYRWANVAIGGGGYVTAVLPSKAQQGLFYARTDVGGAYRFDKSTGRWVPLLDFVSEADVGLMGIESLALDPQDPAVLYVLAGTSYFSNGKTVVMRSTDYGATFSRITDVTSQFHVHGNGMGRGNGEKLQVDPGDSKVLYVGSRDNGLFRSTDAGATFSRLGSLPVTTTPNEAGISLVLLDPSSVSGGRAQRLLVGVSRYGSNGANLYRSDDAGATFTPVANAPGGYMPQRAVLASDGNVYITYANGGGPHGHPSLPEPMDDGQVWKYNLASGTWTNITPPGGQHAYSGITVDPAHAQRVLISTINTWGAQGSNWGDQFFLSTNGGTSWVNVVQRGFTLDTDGVSWIAENSIHWASSIEFDPFDTRSAWVTSGNGVFHTSNIDATPATWSFAVRGLEETVPLGLASVPGGPLLTTIGDYGGFRHTDIDAYAPMQTPRTGSTPGLAVAPAKTSVVVRAGANKIYRSADTGLTWTQVPAQATTNLVALSADGSTLLHTDGSNVTYRSTDFTNATPTWTNVAGLSGSARPTADPLKANKFYGYDSGNGRLLVSTDGGASFGAAATLPAGGSPLIRTAPGREGDVWVPLNGNGLTRSTDSGGSFGKIANVSSCSAVGFGKAMNGASYPTVFIWGSLSGSSTRGLYRSTDAGANWTRINDDAHQFGGTGNGQFVLGDMNTEGLVYMSTVGRGVVYGAVSP